uniref:ATP synthase subunit d, mitochondrial n=1 Tax=Eptatretus burgeri TaxID=7764 RepID=A0A8C4QII0_EPTBU
MAAKRLALRSIDWIAFSDRVPQNQRLMFNALKKQSDDISAKLAALPEKTPTIDWAYYRKHVPQTAMVNDFEKKFMALKIPQPEDTQTSKINAQEKESEHSALKYIAASNAIIAEFEQQLQQYKTMIPFEEMTVEDVNQAFPETRLDKEKNKYWPFQSISNL